MSFNGSGTFNINSAGQPVVSGTVISSSTFNTLTADLATGLSTCITKDGQTTITANIPINSYKITGLAAGTAATDAARVGQLQAGAASVVTVTGTDTYTGTMSPSLGAYAAGNTFTFVVPNTNTTAATLNIDGLGAKALTRDGSTALVAGDLVANAEVLVVYDGTRFQVLNSNSKTNFNLSGTLTVAGNTTLSGGTANGVAYLNASKVLTTGSALTFDGTNFATTGNATAATLIPSGSAVPTNGLNLPSANTVGLATASTQRVTVNSTGNVTINAPSSGAALVMSAASATSQQEIIRATNSTNAGYLSIAGVGSASAVATWANGSMVTEVIPYSSGNYILSAYTGNMLFQTNARTTAMTLDSSGNLLVGTTTAFSASRVTIQGNATYATSILGTAGNTTSNCLFLALGGNRSADTTYSLINYVDTDGTGTARFRVYGNGNVVNTNNSYGAISDIKLKENIVDATPKLDKLLQVRVVNYNLIGEPDNKQLGVVAQELEQVFPAMVSESPDFDADGNDLGTTTKSVKYSVFVPMLIKAIQEQQALIESLTARLNALENK